MYLSDRIRRLLLYLICMFDSGCRAGTQTLTPPENNNEINPTANLEQNGGRREPHTGLSHDVCIVFQIG